MMNVRMNVRLMVRARGLAIGLGLLLAAPSFAVAQDPPPPPQVQPPAAPQIESPAAPQIESLRARLYELNQEQMEEIQRVLRERQAEFDSIRAELQRALESNEEALEEARRQYEEARQQSAEMRRQAEQVLQEALRERQRIVREQLDETGPRPLAGVPGAVSIVPFVEGRNFYLRADSVTWVQGSLSDFAAPPVTYGRTDALLDFALGGQRFVAGVELSNLNPSLARYFEVDSGVLITQVTEGSPGDEAGLLAGDVITEVDGEPVRTIQEVRRSMNRGDRGVYILDGQTLRQPPQQEPISLRVVREGETLDLEIPR